MNKSPCATKFHEKPDEKVMVREVQSSALQGRRVLVVEDEYYLADDMARLLRALGADVVGPVSDAQDALKVCNEAMPLHLAVLDINLKDEMIYPIARELRARGVPFIFASGYDREAVPDEFRDVVLLRKPLDDGAVVRALVQLVNTA